MKLRINNDDLFRERTNNVRFEYKQLGSTTKFETQRSCECRGPLGKLDLFLLVSGHNF